MFILKTVRHCERLEIYVKILSKRSSQYSDPAALEWILDATVAVARTEDEDVKRNLFPMS